MAFIDADHCCQSAFRDFEALWPCIRKNGIVFLRDTYPGEERFLAPWLCNNCYITPRMIKEKSEYEILKTKVNNK